MAVFQNGGVLAGIDGSDHSNAVIDYAIWFAKHNQIPLLLLHTIEHSHLSEQIDHNGNLVPNMREHLLDELSDGERLESKQLIADGKRILAMAKEKAQRAGIEDPITKQRHGTLPEALTDLQTGASIVVLGARGEDHDRGNEGLGAQLEAAIRASHKPIFVTRTRFSKPRKVLFAYNGSPTSNKALNQLKQGTFFDSSIELHIVCVQKTLVEAANLIKNAETELKDLDATIFTKAFTGEAVKMLTQYQQEKAIDITVMGAFSHGKIHGFFFGSFTTQMLLEGSGQYLLIR